MLVSADTIKRAATSFLHATGSNSEEAEIVSADFVEADLCGHDSHGIGLIPMYASDLRAGALRPNTGPSVLREAGPVIQFDGEHGYGQRVGRRVMDEAISRAKTFGISIATLRSVHHLGRIGAYGERAAHAGMISLHYVNIPGSEPIVAPFHGTDGRLSTNPTCIAIPGDPDTGDFVMDYATSVVAYNKLRVAYHAHEAFDQNVVITADGETTNDPSPMFTSPEGAMVAAGQHPHGAMLTFGRHKGYGLSLACELLAGLLSGGNTIQPANPRQGASTNNMVVIVIDPTHFGDVDHMRHEFATMVAFAKQSPADASGTPVLMPGDPERSDRQKRASEGVPIPDEEWQQIAQAAVACGADLADFRVPVSN